MSNICDYCGALNDERATKCIYCNNPLTPTNNTPAPQPAQNNTSSTNRGSTPASIVGDDLGGSETPIISDSSHTCGSDTPIIGGSDTPIIGNCDCCGIDNIFADDSWADRLEDIQNEAVELGIILTDTSKLKKKEEFFEAISSYVDERREDDVEYVLLDIASQCVAKCNTKDIESVLELLLEVYETATPDYLMIVGDSTVIPSIEWENCSRDDDATVTSDLPYLTFDVDSPWSGKEFNFSGITQVGRIPAIPDNGFKEAISYFNCVKNRKHYDKANAWAYSAYEWVNTSITEFTPVSATLLTSPNYTTDPSIAGQKSIVMLKKIEPKFNLLCFNLHGTDSNHKWYGQYGERFYPEAFNSKFLPENFSYFLCCEACYGAKPNVSKSGEQSIVVNALSNNCLAFVGSSRIAYGMGDGSLACADLVVGKFAEQVSKGDTCGLAFLKGLTNQCRSRMRESEIKTIAEFALYGDPSLKLIGTTSKNKKRTSKPSINKPRQNNAFAFSLFACNGEATTYEQKRGRLTLYSCSAQDMQKYKTMSFSINKTGNAFMTKNFSTSPNKEPRIYKLAGKNGYRAVYSSKTGSVNQTVILHLDDDGKIENVYVSK